MPSIFRFLSFRRPSPPSKSLVNCTKSTLGHAENGTKMVTRETLRLGVDFIFFEARCLPRKILSSNRMKLTVVLRAKSIQFSCLVESFMNESRTTFYSLLSSRVAKCIERRNWKSIKQMEEGMWSCSRGGWRILSLRESTLIKRLTRQEDF